VQGIHDLITRAKFGDDRLRGSGVVAGQITAFPIDFAGRPYNTLTLPCERVIALFMKKPSSQKRSGIARIVKKSHSFTCHSRVYSRMEWTIHAFAFPAEAGTNLPRPQRDDRLSWPEHYNDKEAAHTASSWISQLLAV